MDVFEKQAQKENADYIKFNDRQSELQIIIDQRLLQLDSYEIRLAKEENMTEEFKKDVKELNKFCFNLQQNKVNQVTFEERAIDLYTDIRKLRIQVDTSTVEMKNLENFIEKYVPLQTQNLISRTLHGYLNQVQKSRLEDYEFSVFAKLHNGIFEDNGKPDMEKEKSMIISEVNVKLSELQKLYKEKHINIKSNKAIVEEDSDEPQEQVDEEDIAEVLQRQIKEIQSTVDQFPSQFRELDEKLNVNLENSNETNDKRIKILEQHITEVSNEVESSKKKLNDDKAEMISRVEENTQLMEAFQEDYITKSKMLKSLSGTTACILEAMCIKA